MVQPTPLAEIESTVAYLRRTFDSNKTKLISWRRDQLQRLYKFVDTSKELREALKKDLNKNPSEIEGELTVVLNECVHALEHLEEWTSPRVCEKTLATLTDRVETRFEPLGVVCIIAPWNFPIQLVLAPLIPAIAAGCCAVIKPSEVATASEAVLAEWLPKVLDASAIRVVLGGVPETSKLLELKFDQFFYTGSGNIGKIVMGAAAKQLTPVVLELGGKSPTYVHLDVNIKVTANRLMWAKTMNSGQICLAPDYVMVHKAIARPFIEAMKAALKEMFGSNIKSSPDYSRIINKAHTQRLTTLLTRQLAQRHCKLEYGGESSVEERYFEPTIISGVKVTDPLMEDEIFGPIMGVIEVENEDEAIRIIKSKERPLGMYINTNTKAVAQKIMDNTISGSVLVNDYMLNMVVLDMPFGGVGGSGIGAYHGHSGFLAFTHQRGLMWRQTDAITEASHKLLYPPYCSKPTSLQIARTAIRKQLPTTFSLFLKRYMPSLWRFLFYVLLVQLGRLLEGYGVQEVVAKLGLILGVTGTH